MNRKLVGIILTVLILSITGCGSKNDSSLETQSVTNEQVTQNEPATEDITTETTIIEKTENEPITETSKTEQESETIAEQQTESQVQPVEANKMNIQIGDTTLTATLEDNDAAKALKELMRDGGLTINFSMYGGFEQVGSIGTTLPTSDVQTTTSAGDIVLYSGNQMVMFYGSNSWSYTRLAKIDASADDLKTILGNTDVTATFTLAE